MPEEIATMTMVLQWKFQNYSSFHFKWIFYSIISFECALLVKLTNKNSCKFLQNSELCFFATTKKAFSPYILPAGQVNNAFSFFLNKAQFFSDFSMEKNNFSFLKTLPNCRTGHAHTKKASMMKYFEYLTTSWLIKNSFYSEK